MRTLPLLIVICGSMLAGQPQQEERAMTDEQKLQGTWQLVSGERHGKALAADVVNSVTLTFAKDVLTTKNKDHASDARFRLHPNITPKGMDLIMEGNVGEGIYALEADDLKILHGEVGDPRPRTFDPMASPTLTLLVLKRRQ